MDKSIVKILKIKNEIDSSELVIEDCSEHSEALSGYSVVVNYKNVQDVKAFLMKDYSNFSDVIIQAFDELNENDNPKTLLDLLEVYKNGETYTKVILEENGGVESVLGKGISSDFLGEVEEKVVHKDDEPIDSEFTPVENNVEDDEEEMYREMYEELKEKYATEMTARDLKIQELEKSVADLKVLKDLVESLDELEYDDIDMIVDHLDKLPESEFKNLVLDLITENAEPLLEDPKYDVTKLPVLKIYMNQIADWLDKNGHLGE